MLNKWFSMRNQDQKVVRCVQPFEVFLFRVDKFVKFSEFHEKTGVHTKSLDVWKILLILFLAKIVPFYPQTKVASCESQQMLLQSCSFSAH